MSGRTHPFRSPYFPGTRIIVDASGVIYRARSMERIGIISNGLYRPLGSYTHVSESLAASVPNEFEPLLKRLRGQAARRAPALVWVK